MKRLVYILCALLLAAPVYAQYDVRQRDMATMVQDALAQMPLQTEEDFNREMESLAGAAPQSVVFLARMLQPASKGVNSPVEYALSGIVSYVSAPENAGYLAAVRKGLEEAMEACKDEVGKAFLWSQYRLILPGEGCCGDGGTCCQAAAPGRAERKSMLKKAKALAASDNSADRCRSLWLRAAAEGTFSSKELLTALKDEDVAYRNTALEIASGYADDGYVAAVVAKYGSLGDRAKADVVNWIGDTRPASQVDFLVGEAAGGPAVKEAVAALGKIPSEKSAAFLLGMLGTDGSKMAMTALKSMKYDFGGMVEEEIAEAMGSSPEISANVSARLSDLMDIAAYRRMKNTSEEFFALLGSSDVRVALTAKKGLWAVASEADASKVASLLEKSSDADAGYYQEALDASLSSLEAGQRFERVSAFMSASECPERYYPSVASCGTDSAVNVLSDAYSAGSMAALEALMTIDNYNACVTLFDVARNDASNRDRALLRIVELAGRHDGNIDSKAFKYIQALELAESAKARNSIIVSLQDVPVMKAFLEAGKFLDDPAVSYSAALTAKSIAARCIDDIDYDCYREILEKARDIFASKSGADDGYAVDEINLMLSRAKPFGKTVLSEEEAAQGFELLFDGTNLDKWTGDMDGYTPVNGTIFVTANYGNSRNLYTKAEYRDFIFRFEFCFDREGVNNGVGIRTPMGVDAAYDGMCEVQILDHDAPVYKGLHEYQVHGSAYGIVPAKRVVHKPLGEWNTEEIVVKGDRVKVTLNGEVILDADLREACQGHNVSPDGSNVNPYTVDHKNHPGMFNYKGHVGFLGHGAGIRFRNVRILEL